MWQSKINIFGLYRSNQGLHGHTDINL